MLYEKHTAAQECFVYFPSHSAFPAKLNVYTVETYVG